MQRHRGQSATPYGGRKSYKKGKTGNSTSTGLRVDQLGMVLALQSQESEFNPFVKDRGEIYPLGGRSDDR